ncbi:beta-ketoacyl synthase N-terminal-like domain-containing protein [Sorangium sp. So ce726]|uniref:beta-ketoacyl synthase N-terminal-like domain-containing protein n=1 Tax=Sorangium sp. So ce726 TaxID=3133319 RepID=UPI003F6362C2
MAARGADILRIGMVSSVGLSAEVTNAAVRAGIDRFQESSVLDRRRTPLVMALVATPDLPPLAPVLAETVPTMTARQRRMLRLAGLALHGCLGEARGPRAGMPLLLGVPEGIPSGIPAPAGPRFLKHLSQQAGCPLDIEQSRVFAAGRAAALAALEEALAGLASRRYDEVLVGGVDSCLDLQWLGALDQEDRLRAYGVHDGFTPGEGAAFLWLARAGAGAQRGAPALARIDAAATAEEPGHRYAKDTAYLGDGLDAAFKRLFSRSAPAALIPTIYAGLNGESFPAKEWGVAYTRQKKRILADFTIEHPADCLGDTGAALGAMLVALAGMAIHDGYRKGPCLVWCSSDLATRGAALVSGA